VDAVTNLKEPKYTVVQHSGYGYAGKPTFKQALEVRTLHTVGEVRTVQQADGLLFDDWKEADDYTDSVPFLNAPGTFSPKKIDQLRIYQPPNAPGK
jgi:hypothetical protein